MQNDAATIDCPKATCQTSNPETHKFCQKCRAPLPRRYLWAVGKGLPAYKPGQILADRYLRKSEQILLDTKPGFPPAIPEEIPEPLAAYLRLFPYRLHIPQVYGQLHPRSEGRQTPDIWLLDPAPVDLDSETVNLQLRPQLTTAWKNASAMRQMNWLWQIAQLWQPCSTENVASSLLNPELLWVEGPLVRLLQLQSDRTPATLAQLGQMWSQWVQAAKPLLAPFLNKLCQMLIEGRVRTGEHLVALLDRGLAICGQTQSRTYEISTRTDTGPSRRRNEDACYPVSGTNQTSATESLTIVCDGIGGHEGGNVASAIAIEAIRQRVKQLQSHSQDLDPQSLIAELEESACAANDAISDRNNDEQRQGRQRMGTTLVMALAKAHELYITNIGDSRAYLISHSGCYQVTLDDDVATREVRLGYALYRDAVQQPAAGSLVQALGMAASGMLHPSVGRFVIDEDCLFLLCSDGLSDNDRVEQYWESEILPVLTGQTNVATAATRLIALGNSQNGHDNVTVGVVCCRVKENKNANISPELLLAQLDAADLPERTAASNQTVLSTAPTQLVERPRRASNPLPLLLLITMLLGLPVLAYWLIPGVKEGVDPLIGRVPVSNPDPEPATPVVDASVESLNVGSLIRIQNLAPEAVQGQTQLAQLLSQPGQADIAGSVAAGSVVKVLRKQTTADRMSWLQLQVCWIPPRSRVNSAASQLQPAEREAVPVNNNTEQSLNTPSPQQTPAVKPGGKATTAEPVTRPPVRQNPIGWMAEEKVRSVALAIPDPKPEQLGECVQEPAAAPPAAAIPTPTASPPAATPAASASPQPSQQ